MIHVTVTVLLLLVVDEVFGFEKVFLRTALIFGLIDMVVAARALAELRLVSVFALIPPTTHHHPPPTHINLT